MARTVMIMAGGTGGHIFPALAVAEQLRARGWQVVWLGARGGMEAEIVPPRGYPIEWIRFAGLRGKGALAFLLLPLRLLIAFWQSARAIRRRRPQVVLGMGGYASFPGALMAVLLGRPLVIHEQNAIAGLANRLLARVADRVLAAFPGALPRAEVVGNPVRAEIAALPVPAERFRGRAGPLRLLVLGGSLGAQALNEALPAGLALLAREERPQVVHQAGTRHLESLRRAYADKDVAAEVLGFIGDVAAEYARADVVLCRAGATTVAELAAAGVASILVPYPHAVDDHQSANARFLADAGAAILLPQPQLSPERLARLLRELDRPRLLAMAERARALAKPRAAATVADACEELAR